MSKVNGSYATQDFNMPEVTYYRPHRTKVKPPEKAEVPEEKPVVQLEKQLRE